MYKILLILCVVPFEVSGGDWSRMKCLEHCGDGGLCTEDGPSPASSCGCQVASPGTFRVDQGEVPPSCKTPRDYCASSPCRGESHCVSTLGGYFCRCQHPRLTPYGKSCEFIDIRRDQFEYVQGVYVYFKTVPEINKPREFFISLIKPGTLFKMVVKIPDDHRESVFYEKDMELIDVKRRCKIDSYSFIEACKYIKEGKMKTIRLSVSKSFHMIGGQDTGLGQRFGRLKNVTVEIYNAESLSYIHSYSILVDIDRRAMECLPRIYIKGCSIDKDNPTTINKCNPTKISIISSSSYCKYMRTAAEVTFEGKDYLKDRYWINPNDIQIPDELEIGHTYKLRIFYYKIGGPPKLPYQEFLADQSQCWLLVEPCRNVTILKTEKRIETEYQENYTHKNQTFLAQKKGKVKPKTREDTFGLFSSDAKEKVKRYLKLVNHENGEYLPSNIEGNPLDYLISHLQTNPDDLQPSNKLNVSLEETVFRLLQSMHNNELDKDEVHTSSEKMFKIIDQLMDSQFKSPVNRTDTTIDRTSLELEMKEEETRSINIIKHVSKVELGLLSNMDFSEKVDSSNEHYGMITTMNTVNALSTKSLSIPGDDINTMKLTQKGNLRKDSIMKVAFTKFNKTLLNWSEKVTKSPVVQVTTVIDDEIVEDIPVEVTLEVTPDDNKFSGTVKGLIDPQVKDKSQYVTIHKFIANEEETDWGLIHFKFTDFASPLKIKCFFDVLPEYDMITTTDIIINNTISEYQFVAYNVTYDSILYLGVIAEGSVQSVSYSLEMNNLQCLVWGVGNWMDGSCKVSYNSKNGTITCGCEHTSIFSASMFTSPHIINPISDIALFRLFWDNPFVAVVVTVFLIGLVILLIWGRYKDQKETKKKSAELLADSPKGNFPYMIGIYTETYLFAGTSSNVCIQIFGSNGESLVHHLRYRKGTSQQVGQDDWYYIFTENSLGKIKEIELFHNDMGTSPDWFCKKVIIYDATNKLTYIFEISAWISILNLNKKGVMKYKYKHKHVLSSSQNKVEEKGSDKTLSNFVIGLRTSHTWLSIFVRHPRSLFTRCQLIICASSMLFFGMLLSMMFYGALAQKPEDTPAVELTIAEYIIALEAFLIAFPVSLIILYLFRRPMRLMIEKESEDMTNESSAKTKLLEITKKKLSSEIQAFPLFPISLTRKRSLTNNQRIWLSAACEWAELGFDGSHFSVLGVTFVTINLRPLFSIRTVSIITILVCAFFMIFYSLKFGRNKSILWLMSFAIGWVHDIIIFQPLYIVFFSFLLGFFFQQIASVDKLDFVIIEMKQSKLSMAEATLIRQNNPIYRPLDAEEVKVHRMIRERNEFLKWFFLRLMSSVLLFLLVILIVAERQVEHQQIDLQQTRRLASNVGLKGKGLEKVYNHKGMLDFLKAAMPLHCSLSRDPEEVTTNGICTRYSTRIIGIPRLRQQRVRPNTSYIPSLFDGIYTEADAILNYFSEDTRTFLSGWILPDDRKLKSQDTWNYSNHLKLKTTPTFGTTLISYNGGGYTHDLGYTQEESREILFKLDRYNWIDKCTRVIFLEYNLYNPSTNRYIIVTLLAERFREGVYTLKLNVDGEKFWRRDFGIDFYSIIQWGMFVGLYIITIIYTATNFPNVGLLEALRNPKVIIDILCCIFGAYAITSNLTRILYFKFYIEEFLAQTEEKFVSFRYTMYERDFFQAVLGLFAIAIGLKIIFILSDSFVISYFRGLLFIRPTTLLALFIFVFYINSFFNLFTQICGCPSYPGLITIFYDRTQMSNALSKANLYRHPSEYYLTLLYGFTFVLLYTLFQAATIGYHGDAVGVMSDNRDTRKYHIKKYYDKLFKKCKLYMNNIVRDNDNKHFIEIEQNKYFGINKRKKNEKTPELHDYFIEIENSIKKREEYLKYMSKNIDKMLKKLEK